MRVLTEVPVLGRERDSSVHVYPTGFYKLTEQGGHVKDCEGLPEVMFAVVDVHFVHPENHLRRFKNVLYLFSPPLWSISGILRKRGIERRKEKKNRRKKDHSLGRLGSFHKKEEFHVDERLRRVLIRSLLCNYS
ncbi:hypothetical protein AKJ39_00990 [candidate division MSBL1 archaeon SCGC-AAA259J03]|uniref:Uncharacterized protein n=1 Tax=candidate division MSBL1 archaeon SCGC-AAA259J03 TaxID=1698269 RepID=A0A656Z0E1_9EURY|nr:hypothetical protein AKJ39_00990 [candidate division MSBL1 archaeon SCGC-AAA259J03]